MRHIIGTIVGAAILASSFVVNTADTASATTTNVTYCEAFDTGDGGSFVLISGANGRESLIVDPTVRNVPVAGERYLIESPVLRGKPRIFHCMVRTINGVPAMIVTTRGGAEWAILNPAFVR
jgi:hypothetical protein